jgi:cytochrome c oxidase subunit II
LAESAPHSVSPALLDGIVPPEVVARTEKRWLMTMLTILVIMFAIIVVTGITHALQPASHVELVDSQTLHLKGEFVESNLGTAVEPDGSVTVRVLAETFAFVPHCLVVPAGRLVRFRLTSADVVHGFLLPNTNVNTMVVPGFVAEVKTTFAEPQEYAMPCHEFCGLGHHAMWAHVSVVPEGQFAEMTPYERKNCAQQ